MNQIQAGLGVFKGDGVPRLADEVSLFADNVRFSVHDVCIQSDNVPKQ